MADLPRLNRSLVRSSDLQAQEEVRLPAPDVFELPERVLQFGSGRFLRGFADFFIDRAIRQGRFDGRVVVVQSTGTRRSNILDEQDGLYTLSVQGLQDGAPVETHTVVGAVSRALSANEEWEAVLEVARSAALTCILSNTTEVGIRLDEADRLDLDPPRSFPGKLTAFLYERARAFDFAPERGLVVLPCELIEQNGVVLKGIVLDLARRWGLGERFESWVASACVFCNTLVDRIVTGTPSEEALAGMQEKLGYEDRLLTVAEVYRLWAIEGDPSLKQRLPFLAADEGIVVAEDITPYRELKVRILNGTHTVMVPTAYRCGLDTVLEAMQDPQAGAFVRGIMFDEIVPTLDVDAAEARRFAEAVLDRFSNPFIEHLLLNITFQSTTKMRVRVVPSILEYHRRYGVLPRRILFGFANYLLFMRAQKEEGGILYGERGTETYAIQDDRAPHFYSLWEQVDPEAESQVRDLVRRVVRDESLWGTDLSRVPGLEETVAADVLRILQVGPRQALEGVAAEADASPASTKERTD